MTKGCVCVNRKRIRSLVLMIICLCGLGACQQKKNTDILHLGLNAEIVEVDPENQLIYVVDYGENKVFGVKCGIDCKKLIADQEIIYVDYDTQDVSVIRFEDLTVGDKVVINAYGSQLNQIPEGIIEVEQIQLAAMQVEAAG